MVEEGEGADLDAFPRWRVGGGPRVGEGRVQREARASSYLAAHSPTERAVLQTADIARRLMRGAELHQEAEAS